MVCHINKLINGLGSGDDARNVASRTMNPAGGVLLV